MESEILRPDRRTVTPLELFFDLVFVFAIAQLSHHLLEHQNWRGLAETIVLLVGVFNVWSYTSFEVTLSDVRRTYIQRVMLVVMAVGLFMNTAINHAFEDRPLDFVLPMLLIQIGRTALWTIPSAPTPLVREHYTIMLRWLLLSAPLWIAGGVVDSEARLCWWAAAATLDLAGTWLAHPWPGRKLRSEHVAFDGEHMLERLRLFLIIALGEVVLTSGRAIAQVHLDWLVMMAGAFALAILISLWALYFSGSDEFVRRHLDHTNDPILATRLAVNVMVVVVAGLIALAVANSVAIDNPTARPSLLVAIFMSGGAAAYLLAQIWYLHFVSGRLPRSRAVAVIALVAVGLSSPFLPAVAAQGLVALVLLSLWGVVTRQNQASRALQAE